MATSPPPAAGNPPPTDHGEPDRRVLVVRADGAIEAVHDDRLALHELGPLAVRRASNVEFEDPGRTTEGEGGQATQTAGPVADQAADQAAWVARDAVTGAVIARNLSRGACIAEEVRHFNQALADGLRPFDRESRTPPQDAGAPGATAG